MSAPLQSHGSSRSRHARIIWLLALVILAGVFVVLLWYGAELHPEVSLPNGAVLTFETITEPSPPPAGAYPPGSGARPNHVTPDTGPSPWWSNVYFKVWMASPTWAQRWLPRARAASTFFDPDIIMGYRGGIANFRLWFNSAGPDLEVGQWSIAIDGIPTRGYGYRGNVWTLRASSGTPVTTGEPKRWFYVDTDTLPAESTFHVTFTRGAELLTIEVPNPKHRPEAK